MAPTTVVFAEGTYVLLLQGRGQQLVSRSGAQPEAKSHSGRVRRRDEAAPFLRSIPTIPCPRPYLALLLRQPLKHVGVELLLPRELLADPLLAHSQLGLGGFVAGVELQDLLEVSPCQVKVIHCQVGLSAAEKALLVVAVQFQGLRMQRRSSGDTSAGLRTRTTGSTSGRSLWA